MRELLFRGKNRLGKWIYGTLQSTEPFAWGKSFKNYLCITNDDWVDGTRCLHGSVSWVKKETVGQFTGLYDKNGKKIFEGDIVKINENQIDEVMYGYGCFLLAREDQDYEFTRLDFNKIEVIGNIYDNPELLRR